MPNLYWLKLKLLLVTSFRDRQTRLNTNHVKLSREQSAFVADRIAHYRIEAAENVAWLMPRVEKYRVLPLLVNWVETIGIMSNGAIRKFSADGEVSEYEGLRAVDDIQMFLGALVQGARKYPLLLSAIPARPRGAETCKSCLGAGLFPQNPDWVCECGGVGWRLRHDESMNDGATTGNASTS